MARNAKSSDNNFVNLSALDIFANAVGALAFLLLLFAASAIDLARPTTLKILTQRMPDSRVGSEYIGILSAIGGVPPYSWALQSGSLPEGLKLDQERGEVTGIPQSTSGSGNFPFEITVSDSRKKLTRARLEIRVLPVKREEDIKIQPLILLTHGNLPEAILGQPYELYLSARGGSGRYRWSAEGLPPGFAIEVVSGLLRGIPEVMGIYELTLRVRDEEAGSGDAGQAVTTASLHILGAEIHQQTAAEVIIPRILTENLPAAIEAETYEVTLAGTGATPLRWSAQNLPPGLHLDDGGIIRGIPTSTMNARIVVRMEDARNIKAVDKTILLTIKPRPVSILDRVKQQGLWGWVGYILLALFEIAFLFILRRQEVRQVADTLKLHSVDLIQRADGTAALSGSPENMEAVQQRFKWMRRKQDQHKVISYVLLAIAMIGYTIFLLSF